MYFTPYYVILPYKTGYAFPVLNGQYSTFLPFDPPTQNLLNAHVAGSSPNKLQHVYSYPTICLLFYLRNKKVSALISVTFSV